jgi:hypothetical protein
MSPSTPEDKKMFDKQLAVAAALAVGIPLSALAACPKHGFTEPANVKLGGDAVMIVTHASSNDDGRIATKLGVDQAIRYAKQHRIPVVYLQDDRPENAYFMEDCNPDYWVYSTGEVEFDVPASRLYLIGGHLEECMSATVHDVLLNWSRKPRRNLTVTYFMDGIFSNGRYIEASDPYNVRYQRFLNVVTYNKPAGEHFQKITLLETMGLIRNEKQQYEYLQRVLPHFERTLPDYRVELKLMDSPVRIIQRGKGDRPPVLRFHFIDSAISVENAALFRTTEQIAP